MKINLHCHSNYSDGYVSLDKMAQEHKKLGFSAFVVTDHCYPFFVEKGKLGMTIPEKPKSKFQKYYKK